MSQNHKAYMSRHLPQGYSWAVYPNAKGPAPCIPVPLRICPMQDSETARMSGLTFSFRLHLRVFVLRIAVLRIFLPNLLRVKKDQIFYKRAFEDTSQNPLWEYMLEYYCARYAETARERLQTKTLDAQTIFAIRLYSYGTIAKSRERLLSDDPVSADEEVERMHASMPEPLRKIFFPE